MISEQASERAGMLAAARLARLLWAFSVVLVAFSAVLLVLNRNVEDPVAPYWLNLAASALALSTVGALLASQRPKNPIGWLLGASGLLYAVMVSVGEYGAYTLLTAGGSLPGGVVATWLGSWLYVLGANLVVYSFLLFPDGCLPSPRWRVVAWLVAFAICLDTASLALMPGTLYGYPGFENPFGVEALAGRYGPLGVVTSVLALGAILVPVVALIARFRRARGDERQQIKWILYAVAVLVAAIVAVNLWPALDPSFAGAVMFLVGFLAIPAAIGVAIFKYRLYDIDLVINRTLVYAALTVCVVGIYVLVVGYLGALLRTDQPDRLARRDWDRGRPLRPTARPPPTPGEPPDVWRARRPLRRALSPRSAPRSLACSKRCPAIYRADGARGPEAAVRGRRDEAGRCVRVHHGHGRAGRRSPPNAAVQAVRLTDEAIHLSADLQRSRERLVTAREEERRRLRRDLHDGLGPQLAAVTMKAKAARDLLVIDPARSEALLEDITVRAQEAVADIRRLVYGLRPPALDDLGLLGALRAQAAHGDHGGLRVAVDTPEELPPLPAAVEVAAYRIVQEAIINAARHAGARRCAVRIAPDEEERALRLEIEDDGRGIPEDRRAGVGLHSMRERAEELGGTFAVGTGPSGGTLVRTVLPLARHAGDRAAEPEDE